MSALRETEAAFEHSWSHFMGHWERCTVHRRGGLTWFETPIRHLPYNGVVATRMPRLDDGLVDEVLGGYAARDVQCFWGVHDLSTPDRVGAALEARGLAPVEEATCMALDLEGWSGPPAPDGVEVSEVTDEDGLAAYTEITLGYWEIPEDEAPLVTEAHRAFGPRPDRAVRFVAHLDGALVGKGILALDAGTPGVAAIHGMSVRPQARGRGVAGALTCAMLERARTLGSGRVVLHSSPMARGVYARAGFAPVGTIMVYGTAPIWTDPH